MNSSSSSRFMDKQVTGLSGSRNNNNIFDLLNPQEEEEEEPQLVQHHTTNVAMYDFQPIRSAGASQPTTNFTNLNVGGTRVSSFADSAPDPSNLRTYGSLDTVISAKSTWEKDLASYKVAMVSEIDKTMKIHTDKMLNVLEGLGVRLSQMENRTRQLENLVDDLKISIANNHGKADGKLRQLENILREVQTGLQVLRDKQDIQEAHLQLAKLQSSKGYQNSENQKSIAQADSTHTVHPHQSHQSPPPPHDIRQPPQQLPMSPLPNSPHLPFEQIPPSVPPPTLLPQSQILSIPPREPCVRTHGQLPEATHMQYQLPPVQQPQASSTVPHQHFQSALQLSQFSQPPQQYQPQPPLVPVNPSPQMQHPSSNCPEENPYIPPPQSYPQNVCSALPLTQPRSMPPPSQQYYSAPPHMYKPSSGRAESAFPSGYGAASGLNFIESYPYSGSHSHYESPAMKPSQLSSSSTTTSGRNSYQRLPTAQILPHAVPINDNTTSSSGGSENKVPVDDVVDKLATMGFSGDQVRAAMRKLTENGQSTDLNVVLDKLMNGSGGSENKVPVDDVDKLATMGFSGDQVRAAVRKLTENGQSTDLNVVLDKLMNGDVQPEKGWYGR